jgi:hypothetical protein
MLTLILLMWFTSIALFVISAIAQRAPSRVQRPVERLFEAEGPALISVDAELRVPLAERVLRPALHHLARRAARVTPAGELTAVRAWLDASGKLPRGVREFLGERLGAASVHRRRAPASLRRPGPLFQPAIPNPIACRLQRRLVEDCRLDPRVPDPRSHTNPCLPSHTPPARTLPFT